MQGIKPEIIFERPNSTECPLVHPEKEPWWIAQADFLRLEYTAEQVARLLGITPAMVQDLEKRGLLKLTKGRGTAVYTAAEVVNYLKRVAQTESRANPTRDPSGSAPSRRKPGLDRPAISGDGSSVDVQQEFWHRLTEDWLPAYCHDPARRYDPAGFRTVAKQVTDVDARDFLRALDHDVVSVDSGGRFRMPQSKTHEVIFWEHSTSISPRPITLWLEPVITIAAVARLHLDYGWPKECLGMQSQDSAFDLMAFRPDDLENESIAGEVKGNANQLDRLLAHMGLCAVEEFSECSAPTTRKNAHRKLVGLKRCRAPIFWAIGPSGDSRVFDVAYEPKGRITLSAASHEKLRFA